VGFKNKIVIITPGIYTTWGIKNLKKRIIIIATTMFMLLSSWPSHCESSPCSFDECRLSAGWLPTLRPSQSTWTVNPQKNWLLPSTSTIAIVIITQPISWYSFYRPTKGGRLNRPRHYSKGAQLVPKAVCRSGRRDKHNRSWVLSHCLAQSDELTTRLLQQC